MHARKLSADITALQDYIPVPGFGALAVNAFVLHAAQPMLVDTGLPNSRADFLDTLGSVIDPADLRWIWVSHADRDHIGSLYELLDVAPQARVVITFEARGVLNIERPLPVDRIYLLNPGQSLDLGDRSVTAFRPPLFDSPGVIGFTDSLTGTAFTSDCFGAPTTSIDLSLVADIAEVPAAELAYGQTVWATIDSAWVTSVDRAVFARTLEPLREIDPPLLLSSHLPPAVGRAGEFLDRLATVPDAPPFVGPDQAAFEQLLRKLAPGAAPSEPAVDVPS